MLSEKFSLAAAIRWIYSDLRFDYQEENSPASAFAADIAAYYQNYVNIGPRECQLGVGLNISNIGSKITFSGRGVWRVPAYQSASGCLTDDSYRRVQPLYHRRRCQQVSRADGSCCRKEGEDNSEYEDRVHREYNDISGISGIFKSFSDAPGGFKEELEEINYGVGAEYTYNDKFALRAGYHHESQSKGNRKYFTVGSRFQDEVFSAGCLPMW